MQLEIVLCKEEGIYEFCAEMPPSSLGLKSSDMDWKTVETCSLVRRVHISACFWEKQTLDSMCQRRKRPSRLLPRKSAKTSLCDGIGVHQCLRHGWSAYMWRYHWCRGLWWNFGETYAAVNTRPAVQICLLLKMYGTSWRGDRSGLQAGTVVASSSKSYIHQEWATITRAKLQQSIC